MKAAGSTLSLKCILGVLQGDIEGVKVIQRRHSTEKAEPVLYFFQNVPNLRPPGWRADPCYLELLLCGNYKTHPKTRRPKETDSYWTHGLCSMCTDLLFLRGVTAKPGFPSPPPFTNAATENGHHGTHHPSSVPVLWSAPGNWSDVLVFRALDYSLASYIFWWVWRKPLTGKDSFFKCGACVCWPLSGKSYRRNKPPLGPREPLKKTFGS